MAKTKAKRWHQLDACEAAFNEKYPARPKTGDEMRDCMNDITRGIWHSCFWDGWWAQREYMNKLIRDRKKKAKK